MPRVLQSVGDGAVLRDAVVMKPGSCVESVYQALKTLKVNTPARLRSGR